MAAKRKILVIDNNKKAVDRLCETARKRGFYPFGVYTGGKGFELAISNIYDAIVMSIDLPDQDSLELLNKIKGAGTKAPVIMIGNSAYNKKVTEAFNRGAYAFLDMNSGPEMIIGLINNALENIDLKKRLDDLKKSLADRYRIIGFCPAIRQLKEKISRIARSSSKVLIIGEPGCGKLRIARYIHYSSPRATGPFMIINCASKNSGKGSGSDNIERELFGYQQGAFDGADQTGKGKLEMAHGGSVYLREIGALGPDMQARLLHTIETGTVKRLAGTTEIKTDIRIIAGTTGDLEALVKTGKFREDLYFRLNVIPVTIPPLRDCVEDIPALAEYLLEEAGLYGTILDDKSIELLRSYNWPGNMGELKKVIEKSAKHSDGNRLDYEVLRNLMAADKTGDIKFAAADSIDSQDTKLFRPDLSYRRQMNELEKKLLREVFHKSGGNITKAATMLKTDRGNLSKKLKKLGITAADG